METLLRAALIDWLRADPVLAGLLNTIDEEAPVRASPPWLGLAASASADWGAKGLRGREVRIALELQTRSDDPAATANTTLAIEQRVEGLPRQQTAFDVVNVTFLRTRAEQRPGNRRAVLLEYRFRLLEA